MRRGDNRRIDNRQEKRDKRQDFVDIISCNRTILNNIKLLFKQF